MAARDAKPNKKPLDAWEIKEVLRTQYAIATKERKRAGIDPRAADVLNVYPRREGGDAALVSISKAIAQDGLETVLERTTEYASAVARWPIGRKRSQSGSSLIPLPTTFYNSRRYMDDSAAWWEGTGGRDKATKPKSCLPEWPGWRFKFADSMQVRNNVPWENIDEPTQAHIINVMSRDSAKQA